MSDKLPSLSRSSDLAQSKSTTSSAACRTTASLLRQLTPWPVKYLPWPRARGPPVVNYDLPIDQHVINAFGRQQRLFVSRAILHLVEVEDHYVGPLAFTDHAAIGQTHSR